LLVGALRGCPLLDRRKGVYIMRPRTKPRPPVPTDEEILSYDNVPVAVAARYLDWTESAVRQALREGRANFGIPVRDKGVRFEISPGGLVAYKRVGAPCVDYNTIKEMVRAVVTEVVTDVVRQEISDLKLALYG